MSLALYAHQAPASAGPSADGLQIVLVAALGVWLLGVGWTMLLAHLAGCSKVGWSALSLSSPLLALGSVDLLVRISGALGGAPSLSDGFGFFAMIAIATAQFWLPMFGLFVATRLADRRERQG